MNRIRVLLALCIAAPAGAQTTDCLQTGAYTNCTTRPSPSNKPVDYLGALGLKNQPAPDYAGDYQRARAAKIRARLADLIETHQCEEAKVLAIREGGLEAGERVVNICK